MKNRTLLRLFAWLLLLVCLAAVAISFLPAKSRKAPSAAVTSIQPEPASPAASTALVHSSPVQPSSASAVRRSQTQASHGNFPEPAQGMRDLVRNVVNLDALGGVVNEEQATAWKQRLHLLIEQGPGAVSAIREFLSGNSDIDFGSAGKQLLGYPTARAAMIDALGQIGGQSSVDTMTELLGSTADPREIALLAQNLDKLQPGIYQAAALDAARQTLAMAAQGNLPSRDVAPLFELIQRYGGASAVSDLLQNAGQWNYYAMMTLGQLPDGAGISALTQVASGQAGAGSGAKIAALQMVAQAASQSDEARTFLVEQARQGAFSAYLWAALMPILAGDQMTFQNSAFEDPLAKVPSNELRMAHLSIGNQNYLTAPLGVMTADQAQRQMALIQALSDVTSDPEGRSALQQAKNLLQQRSAQFAAVPAPGTGP